MKKIKFKKIWIQGLVLSFKTATYSFYLKMYIPIPFIKRYLLSKRVESWTVSHTFAVNFCYNCGNGNVQWSIPGLSNKVYCIYTKLRSRVLLATRILHIFQLDLCILHAQAYGPLSWYAPVSINNNFKLRPSFKFSYICLYFHLFGLDLQVHDMYHWSVLWKCSVFIELPISEQRNLPIKTCGQL